MMIKWKIFGAFWKISVFCKRYYRTEKQLCWVLSVLIFTVIAFYSTVLKNHGYFNKSNKNYTKRWVRFLQSGYKLRRLEHMLAEESILEDKGTGCEMPALDPFSAVVMQHNRDMPKVVCEGLDWVECHYSKCYIVNEILNKMKDIVCTYKDIVYVNDQHYYIASPVKIHDSESYTLNNSDHVKVSCTGTDKSGLGILLSRWFGYKAGLRPVPQRQSPPGRENTINVMILCFDSASHNGFIRKMPKSYQVLKHEMNATIFKSHNILGEGTINAMYPILTGLDLPDWDNYLDKVMDYKSFLFHHFKEDGYRTAYLEDMPWIGTFQKIYRGFSIQPADHYLRAMLLEESANGRKWWHGIKGRYCIGSIPQYRLILNLTKQFFDLKGKRFCLTFVTDICHDDFNMISTADDDVVTFLRQFRDQGKLEDTLLIVMGDHGTKYESSRKIYQGRIEERLPLMAIMLPTKLGKTKPNALANLKANAEVLTTHYDVHTTLLDVVGLKKYANGYKVSGSDLPRAMSMLEPIPKSRSCSEAGIMPHWCACARWRNVSKTDPVYQQAANVLAEYIDNMLHDKLSLCAKRKLTSVEWVMRRLPNSEVSFQESMGLGLFWNDASRAEHEYYQVKITMSPGEAIFEASMSYYVKEDYFLITERDISRISAYGDEPHCVIGTHPQLIKYCYCKDQLKTSVDKGVSTLF